MIQLNKPSLIQNNQVAATAKEPAKVWLNIGFEVEVDKTDTQGVVTRETVFINLPFGLALDQMQPVPVKGSSIEFRAIQEAKNDLLDQLVKAGMGMEPGTASFVDLKVQLRKVGEAAAPIGDANPFLKKVV